jgi:antitoxin component YwqK of YwqJK toxin-antitoxin module
LKEAYEVKQKTKKRGSKTGNIKKVLFGKALTVLLIILFVSVVGCSEEKEGPNKTYYKSGKLKTEFTHKNGEKDGLFKTYYESGELQSETNFKDGKEEGLLKLYYKSGELRSETNLKNGLPDGPVKNYNENGELIEEN